MNITEEGGHKLTDAKRQGYAAVLAIGSTRCKANILGMATQGLSNRWHICFYYVSVLIWTINFSGHSIMQNLPSIVQALCENWNGIHTNEFPNIGSWVHKAHGLVCQNLLIYINDLYLLLMVFMSCLFFNCNHIPNEIFVFVSSEMHLQMTLFHQRVTSVPSKQLIWAHWAVRLYIWPLLSNTSYFHWFASLVTSSCESLICLKSLLFFIFNQQHINSIVIYVYFNIAVVLSLQHRGTEFNTGCTDPAPSSAGEQHRECCWD